ncbi:hypothetical protein Pelo_7058 [Pelomyxa schiedti]|nr:hypothetical protein Pelo_7058 [Pelomyxa schiedti]
MRTTAKRADPKPQSFTSAPPKKEAAASGATKACPATSSPKNADHVQMRERLTRIHNSWPKEEQATHKSTYTALKAQDPFHNFMQLFEKVLTGIEAFPAFLSKQASHSAPILHIKNRLKVILDSLEEASDQSFRSNKLKIHELEVSYFAEAVSAGFPSPTVVFASVTGNLALVKSMAGDTDVILKSDAKRNTLLHLACLTANPALLDFLLTALGAAKLEEANNTGALVNFDEYNPAHLAAYSGSADCLSSIARAMGSTLFSQRDRENYTPILTAIMCNQVSCVQTLATCAPDCLNICWLPSQFTPLHFVALRAAGPHSLAMARAILQQPDANVNALTPANEAALHFAIENEAPASFLSTLLECTRVDPNLQSPASFAVKKKNGTCLGCILKCPRLSNEEKVTALMCAVEVSWLPGLELIATSPGFAEQNTTALSLALERSLTNTTHEGLAISAYLLSSGAKPTAICLRAMAKLDRADLLHLVSTSHPNLGEVEASAISLKNAVHKINSIRAAELLVSLGADFNAISKGKKQHSSLISAIVRGKHDVAAWITKLPKINVNHKDSTGKNALFWAAHHKNNDLAFQLLEVGVDPHCAIPLLASQDNIAVMKAAVSAPGVNVKGLCDSDGKPVLHIVQSPEIAELLCSVGADVNATLADMTTPLMSSIIRKKTNLALWFVRHSEVLIDVIGPSGYNALYLALSYKQIDVVKEILKVIATCMAQNVTASPPAEACPSSTDTTPPRSPRATSKSLITSPTKWSPLHLLFIYPELIQQVFDTIPLSSAEWDVSGDYSLAHLAAHNKSTVFLECLAGKGADMCMRAKDHLGFTPYEMAVHHIPPFTECIQLLRDKNAAKERITAQIDQGLPNECLAIIFSYLSVTDLNACACTCKQWRDVSVSCKQYAKFAPQYQKTTTTEPGQPETIKPAIEWRIAAVDQGSRWDGWVKAMGPEDKIWCAMGQISPPNVMIASPPSWKNVLSPGIGRFIEYLRNPVPGMFAVGTDTYVVAEAPTGSTWNALCHACQLTVLNIGNVFFLWRDRTFCDSIQEKVEYISTAWKKTEACCDMWAKLLREGKVLG